MNRQATKTGLEREHFEEVLADFVEINSMACEGLLGVCRLEYTAKVPTLAVTLLEDPPRLLVNPDFLAEHVLNEDDAAAVLLHEFLHVLLGHTKLFSKCDAVTNLALDAVINNIVQRELGDRCGEFFRRFYEPGPSDDPVWLLRPHAPGDILPTGHPAAMALYNDASSRQFRNTPSEKIHRLRLGLGEGRVLADDVLDLCEEAGFRPTRCGGIFFIGNHEEDNPSHPENLRRIDEVLRQFNGSGVFRRPQAHGAGFGADSYETSWAVEDPWAEWSRRTVKILRRVLCDDQRGVPTAEEEWPYLLPVATAGDRRAVLRSSWNPILPDFSWVERRPAARGLANIYLDVSGSMWQELEHLTGLLWKLRGWIRTPLHAFSDGVVPATFDGGRLVTNTSGGTRFNEVLEHVVKNQPGKALVITDGYIEPIAQNLLARCRKDRQRLEILVSADGTTAPFDRKRVPATLLPENPTNTKR